MLGLVTGRVHRAGYDGDADPAAPDAPGPA